MPLYKPRIGSSQLPWISWVAELRPCVLDACPLLPNRPAVDPGKEGERKDDKPAVLTLYEVSVLRAPPVVHVYKVRRLDGCTA